MHTLAPYIAALTALSSISPAVALPASSTNKLHKRIAPNAQSCTATDNALFLPYSVNIGEPYDNGNGCNDVLNGVKNTGCVPSNWQCVDDGNGMTQLWFDCAKFQADDGDELNTALENLYPTVNGFNCPNS